MLKIESTRYAIDVHNLSGEIQPLHQSAFHGLWINLGQFHATRCNKFFLESGFTTDGISYALRHAN